MITFRTPRRTHGILKVKFLSALLALRSTSSRFQVSAQVSRKIGKQTTGTSKTAWLLHFS